MKGLILTGLVAASVAASITLAPALATVLADYLQLESVEVETSSDGLNAEFTAEGEIPEGDDA